MKFALPLLVAAAFSSLHGQEQRLRSDVGTIPEPAEYWEDLEPVAVARPLGMGGRGWKALGVAPPGATEPEERRLKPIKIPAWQTRYTLGPGDTLNFSVYDRPDLARENVQIAPDGTVSYLQAVAVHAEGLTLDQLRTKIEEEISDYQDAKVIISPVDIASKDFAIIGRVRQPGSYNLDRPTSILEAISLAQGIEGRQSVARALGDGTLPRKSFFAGLNRVMKLRANLADRPNGPLPPPA